MEIWKEIKGYPNYMVSNMGNVKSLERIDNNNHPRKEKIIAPIIDNRKGKGYYRVTLCKNGKQKRFQVHRLVYETFVGKIPEGMQCNHINEMKECNRLDNLSLMSPKENANWGTRNERIAEKAKGRKLTEEAIRKRSEKRAKPVLQIDKNTNEVIAEFPSIIEVERQLGYSQGNISACCNGGYFWKGKWFNKYTAYGYKWQFKNG